MFKKAKFEQEIFEGMKTQLIKNASDNAQDKTVQALDYLNKAAELLDAVRLYKSAEIVTRVIEKVATRGDEFEVKSSRGT